MEAHCPESAGFSRSAPPYGKKVDVFSAGVVLGCLLFATSEADVVSGTVQQWRASAKELDAPQGSHDRADMYRLFCSLTDPCAETRPTAAEALAGFV